MGNLVFSELDKIFGKIAVKFELIVKLNSQNNNFTENFAKNKVL